MTGTRTSLGSGFQPGVARPSADKDEVARLLRLAAGQDGAGGHGPSLASRYRRQEAQCRLAVMHLEGRGSLPRNEREAAHLLQLAAEDGPDGRPGHRGAQYFLAFMVLEGRGGLPQDEREAVRLWQEAAKPVSHSDWGHMGAQSILGLLFKDGLCGLPKDLDKARNLFWYPGGEVAEAYNGSASICLEILGAVRPGKAEGPGARAQGRQPPADPLAAVRECFAHWVAAFPEVGHDTHDDSATSQARFDRRRWAHVLDRLRDLLEASDPGEWDLSTIQAILRVLVDIARFHPEQPIWEHPILAGHPQHVLALARAGIGSEDVPARHLLLKALGRVEGDQAEVTALLQAYCADRDETVRLRATSVLARRAIRGE